MKFIDELYKDLKTGDKEYFSLPFDFSKSDIVIDDLIEHFGRIEDYAKCEELCNLKNA